METGEDNGLEAQKVVDALAAVQSNVVVQWDTLVDHVWAGWNRDIQNVRQRRTGWDGSDRGDVVSYNPVDPLCDVAHSGVLLEPALLGDDVVVFEFLRFLDGVDFVWRDGLGGVWILFTLRHWNLCPACGKHRVMDASGFTMV